MHVNLRGSVSPGEIRVLQRCLLSCEAPAGPSLSSIRASGTADNFLISQRGSAAPSGMQTKPCRLHGCSASTITHSGLNVTWTLRASSETPITQPSSCEAFAGETGPRRYLNRRHECQTCHKLWRVPVWTGPPKLYGLHGAYPVPSITFTARHTASGHGCFPYIDFACALGAMLDKVRSWPQWPLDEDVAYAHENSLKLSCRLQRGMTAPEPRAGPSACHLDRLMN